MSDILLVVWLYVTAIKQQSEIYALQETNSFLWAEGENTTARLKACEKKGRR